MTPRERDERGTVTLEMLLAFLPFLTLVLGILQLALMAAAQMGVRHAAVMAARSAAVAVDDAPRYYDREQRGNLESGAGGGPWGSAERLMRPLFGGEPYLSRVWYGQERRGSARLAQIRRAAVWGVAPFSASSDVIGPWTDPVPPDVANPVNLSQPPVMLRFGNAFMGYARAATAVTFPDRARAGMQRVRVTYLFPCAIPLASRLICNSLAYLAATGPAQEVIANAEYGYALSPDGPNHQTAYFQVLTAEATLPRVDAPYLYREEIGPP